tara:strand:- start:378 stop:533 length:156 start_codon:yes stop_codon:yes gene_type:complete
MTKVEKLYSLMLDEDNKYYLLVHDEETDEYEEILMGGDVFDVARVLQKEQL